MKFFSSVRIDTRRKEILPDNKGIRVKARIVKSKVAVPFKTVHLDINFGTGIDRLGSMLDAALELGIVERRGSWYSYKDEQLAQGRINTVELMREHEIGLQIENDVRNALTGPTKGQSLSSVADLSDHGEEQEPSELFDENTGEDYIANESGEALFL